MNKNEEVLEYFPNERNLLYSKDFVILAGDSTEDPKMVTEKHHKAIYRIGFCGTKDQTKLSAMMSVYKELYDEVLSGESEMTGEAKEIIKLLSS
jgi:hypothetical protein